MRMITDPAKLAAALQMVPYVPGGSSWAGADCWGINELWYRNRHGIELSDRMEIEPGPAGLAEGFGVRGTGWLDVPLDDGPREGDAIIMRAVVTRDKGRSIIEHGHCGVFTLGRLLHSRAPHGCVHQPLDAPGVAGRITAILRRVELV